MAARNLKNKMTSCADNFPSFIAEDCIYILARPQGIIFNLILSTVTP